MTCAALMPDAGRDLCKTWQIHWNLTLGEHIGP